MSGEVHLFGTFCLITKPYLSGSGSRARPGALALPGGDAVAVR
jgi:hypothetical protein